MKIRRVVLSVAALLAVIPVAACGGRRALGKELDKALKVSAGAVEGLAGLYYDSEKFPRSWDPSTGRYKDLAYRDWTSGFFPGELWLCYSLTGQDKFKTLAEHFTAKGSEVPYMTHTHDLGFMVMCGYGRWFELEGNETAKEAVIQAARSLSTRFNPEIGLIRSWNFGKWSYPVIIDNMMNLELLFKAAELSGEQRFRDIAVSHADRTLENHFREDASSWHVVSYNPDGSIESKGTHQGYSDDSRWARGQAWGLYGYTMCYRFTGDARYLEQAERIAELIMTLPTMPEDSIPYWDYDAPGIPDEPRDASAAAITASALLELQAYVPAQSSAYIAYAEGILRSLASPQYLSEPAENGWFILKHSTGAAPSKSEIDVALNYADYYFLEAISRYKALNTKPKR